MSQQPHFLYFDMGNVLLHFDHELACRQLAALGQTQPERVREFVFESRLQAQYERGEIETAQFHRAFCRQFGVALPAATTELAASDIFSINLALVPLIVQLSAARRRLGILSNTCDAHWRFCTRRYTILNELFEVAALSFQLRSSKPEASIYQRAAELAGVEPNRIFFTDDRPENVAAARQVGLDAVVFSSVPQLVSELENRGIACNY